MTHLDGNALSGPLYDVFRVDMTMASGRCAGCGHESVLAETMVFPDAPGLVVRCSHCGGVLMTVVQSPDDTRVDLSGIRVLRVPR